MNSKSDIKKITGKCLCGAVRYEITGALRGVVNCHCSKCRRFHGHFGAYTSILEKDLSFVNKEGLKWFHSTTDETAKVYRGFCSHCGSSLFWHSEGRKTISVAAGSIDDPTCLSTLGHIWLSQISDYYTIEDELPKFSERWDNQKGN